ncbi:MAG TPA: hypothetical protein VKS20_07115 [Candidatus Acidoferrales bacterium]|nr:hypothetical protein [Candidatus Acidoferrales bacterium]
MDRDDCAGHWLIVTNTALCIYLEQEDAMKCSVCGCEIGLWAKLTGHSDRGLCKKCEEQGRNQQEVLVQAIKVAPSFKIQYAEGWLNQFEETAKKYHMPESESLPLRFALFDGMFKLVEAEEPIPDADVKFILDVCQRYGVPENAPPDIKDVLFRIIAKQTIQSWERGELPQRVCEGLILQKAEVCYWEEAAGLRIQKIKREYVGGYSSVSVPVPMIRGVRFRVGGFKGHPIDHTILDDGGTGMLHITNQRVCFTGQQHSIAIPFKKMIAVNGFEGGFTVQTANDKKPGIFIVRQPELTTQISLSRVHLPHRAPLSTRKNYRPFSYCILPLNLPKTSCDRGAGDGRGGAGLCADWLPALQTANHRN